MRFPLENYEFRLVCASCLKEDEQFLGVFHVDPHAHSCNQVSNNRLEKCHNIGSFLKDLVNIFTSHCTYVYVQICDVSSDPYKTKCVR